MENMKKMEKQIEEINEKDKGKQKIDDVKKVGMEGREEFILETCVKKKIQELLMQFERRRYDINTRLLSISSKINSIQQILSSGSISTILNCPPARELQILQTETCQRLIHALEREDYYMRIELVKIERDITFHQWCLKHWKKLWIMLFVLIISIYIILLCWYLMS